MVDDQAVFSSRTIAEASASAGPSPGATAPETAGPANSTSCPTYGWTGWTVELSPPPKAHSAVKQMTALVQVVFQAMVDQLGVGDKAAVPDVNELLRLTGLSDTIDKSLVTDAHNIAVERMQGIKQGLIAQHRHITASVAATAKMGTALNRDIWNEVADLRAALHAAGNGKLSTQMEIGLLDRLRTSLRTVWQKYNAVTDANKSNGNAMGPLTLDDLKSLAPGADPDKLRQYLPYLNRAILEAGITTPKREAAFLAQIIHETDKLKTLTEYGDEDRFNRLYGPQTAVGRSLGNTNTPRDGARYPGRGALQITGRSNYREAGKHLGIDLERYPEEAAKPEHAFDVAAWYWTEHDLNAAADQLPDDPDKLGRFDAISREINGGSNGAAERREYYLKARDRLDGRDVPDAD
ncbi:glycoside hydrolase family 19 protein [Nocardia sp. CA-119907]|uniref:glycoside hydrolase family 19 protein n=1 Tax=Nocardia sp. CA-119907 TaxID=3239973 RepID=UPI003D978ABF